MKKILLLLIPFLFIPQSSFSQITDKNLIGVEIIPILPLYSQAPRWTIGYHHRLNDRYYAGLKLGYGDSSIFNDSWYTFDENYTSYYIGGEIIYLIKPLEAVIKKSHTKMFFWSDVYFIHHSETFLDQDYLPKGSDDYVSFERADYKRNKYGINAGLGFFIPIFKNIYIIPKGGIGPKIRDVKFDNIIGIHEYTDNEQFDFGLNNFREVEGTKLGLNLNLEIKVVYGF